MNEAPAPDSVRKRQVLSQLLLDAFRDGRSNLSSSQQRMWFLSRLAPDNPQHCSVAFEIHGSFDQPTLDRALAETVARHTILRTSFREVGGRALAVVAETAPVRVRTEIVDERLLEQRIADEARATFALDRAPLLRVVAIAADTGSRVLLFTAHEAVADPASLHVLVEEVATVYRALRAGAPVVLQEVHTQYATHVARQRQQLSDEMYRTQLAYWQRQLAELRPPDLPTDRPRPSSQTFRGGRAVGTYPAKLVAGLRQLAEKDDDQLDIVVLAAFATLLGRTPGSADLSIGLLNRSDPDLARSVGPLTDVRVIRTDLSGDPSFRQMLGRVRATVREAEANDDIPFEKLIEELSPDRDLSRPPLFQVAVEVQRQPAAFDLGDARLVPLDVDWRIAKLDLELGAVRDDNGDLVTRLVYNADLYDHTTAEGVLERLHRLLDAVVAEPDQPLSAVSLLNPAEWMEIRRLSAGAEVDLGERLVPELIEHQARTSPNAVAVAAGESTLTYQDIDRHSNRIARRLRLLGVGVHNRVGVFCHRSPTLIVALLAVLKAGAAYVPLDPGHPAARNALILGDARVRALLTESSLTSRLEGLLDGTSGGLDAAPLVVDQDDDLPDASLDQRASLSDLAYLIYTSGSTGTPKGVMITHGGLLNYVVWAAREYRVAEGTGSLLHSSIAFDLTVTSVFPALISGRTVRIVADDAGAGPLVAALRHDDRSLVKLTPAHMDLISELSTAGHADIPARRVVVGGEALHGETVRRWAGRGPETTVVNEYGPTETVVGCCAHAVQVADIEPGPVPIGRPIANTQLYLLDESLQPVPFGALGELYVGGMGVAKGYFGKPGLTAERFLPDPFSDRPGARLYRTGDLARYSADGNLIYGGRVDFQIKLRGYRIEPGEIEAALNEHPAVRQSTVVAREDIPGDRRLVAYLVTDDGAYVSHAECVRHLAQRLPDYMIPAAFVELSTLPLAANGKVDRAALPAVQANRPEVSTEFVMPRTGLEADVARHFAALLDVETIGLDDDFLELGGHSLLLAQLASRLSHAYEVTIPVARLFATPTVRGVSLLIEVCANEGAEAAVAMADRVDLLSEAAVEPALTPAGLPPAGYDDPGRVLLTGVTGFLGAHLLRELLEQTRAEVWCLVRASDEAGALDRVERTQRRYRIWRDDFRPRIKVVPGDIAKPRLGLSAGQFELLAATVDSIYHSAALVNFVYPYSTLKAPNVGGTKALLELACHTRAKAFHHISAVDVFVRGEDRTLYEADPLEPGGVPAGYIQSKWVAEKMVATVRDRGLPVTIYRPWIILGHSVHGSAHTTDYTCVFLKGCVELRAAPDIPMTLNVMPADYVSRAIVHISRQPAGRGGIFHFANPHAEELATVWDWVRGYGYDLERLSYRDWHARAQAVSPASALYKILPILIDGEEDLDTSSPENFRPRIDTSHTDAILAGSGITCPPVSRELSDTVLDYLIDVDYLEPPYDRSDR